MTYSTELLHRRRFLHQAGGLAAGLGSTMLLSGCGGAAGASGTAAVEVISAPAAVVPAPISSAPTSTAAATPDAVPLNFALNVAYLGAQYYGQAANGAGLADPLMTGVGRQGGVTGARQVAFADAEVARAAREMAADKLAQVTALRDLLSSAAAAQPALDFSAGASAAAGVAGIVAPGAAFDAFAGDQHFLFGALFVEDVVAAAHRSLLDALSLDASTQLVTAHLAESIYHGGIVRTLLADRAAQDPGVATMLATACAGLARLDGNDVGAQSLADTDYTGAASANLVDADGSPLPFTRAAAQVLHVLYLAPGGAQAGGFLPYGANGLSA